MSQNQEPIARALLVLIDRVERMHAKADEAFYMLTAVRESLNWLSVQLEAKDPQLATLFQDFSTRLVAVAGSGHADPEIDEIRRQLSELLPK
jgi:hypothetical protein